MVSIPHLSFQGLEHTKVKESIKNVVKLLVIFKNV